MSLSSANIDFRKKISEIQSLPVLPKVSEKLMELREDENASIDKLANIITHDPVIAAQVLKHVNSAFFGTDKQIDSLEDAINRIGFNVVLNMAFGIATAKAFNIPNDGPIGAQSFWQHAVYSAYLAKEIASKVFKW